MNPIDAVRVFDLIVISDLRGSVIKQPDEFFVDLAKFDHLYFSTMEASKTKSWKLHTLRGTLLFCLRGEIEIEVRDSNGFRRVIASSSNAPKLISIPNSIWFRMANKSDSEASLIASLSDGPHDFNEAIRLNG